MYAWSQASGRGPPDARMGPGAARGEFATYRMRIVSEAETELPFRVARITGVCTRATTLVLIVNVAEVCPAGTKTVDGAWQ